MANKEIVNVLTVKTEQSEKTIKSLREEIARLKKEFEQTEIGSESFERAQRELAQAQDELKTAIKGNTTAVEDAEGSYNALTKQMAQLKKEWKATADEFKRGELGKEIDVINDQLKELDATIGNNQRLVGSYAEEFKKAMDAQQESTIGVRMKLEGLQKVATGLASGYAAFQGVTALLGIENENLEKALVKVQAAMAIAQGIGGMKDLIEGAGTLKVAFKGVTSGVKTFITGLKGVKAAIIGTGIGIFVVLLGEIIAHWDKISKLWKNTEAEEKAKVAMDKLNTSMETNATTLKSKNIEALKTYTEDLKKAKGDVDKIREATEKYNKALEDNDIALKKKNLADAKIAESETFAAYIKLSNRKRRNPENEIVKAFTEAKNKRIQLENELEQALAEADNKAAKAKADAEAERIAEAKERRKEAAAKQKETQEKAIADAKTAQEKADADAKAAEQKRIADQEHNIDRWADLERRKLEKQQQAREEWASENDVELDGNGDKWYTPEELENYQAFLDAKQAMYAESISAENLLIQSQIEKLQELADAQAAAGMDNTGTLESIEDLKLQMEENNEAILKNEKDTLKAKAKANEEYAKQEKLQEKQLTEYKLSMASNVLGSLSSILGEQTAAGKAAAVAQATIDTYMAANSAYSAMAGIPVVGPALGAAAAAAAVIAGIANVKKILSTSTDGSNASSVIGSGAAATPNVNLADAMPVQYTRELLTDTETTNMNREQRVYVLESDITDTQDKVAVTESNSSF